jgi:hypothetical protein
MRQRLVDLVTADRHPVDIVSVSIAVVTDSPDAPDKSPIDEAFVSTIPKLPRPGILTTADLVHESRTRATDLSADGNFIRRPPSVTRSNSSRMEIRLSKIPQFFDELQKLRSDAPQLRSIPPTLRKSAKPEPTDATSFMPANVWGIENSSTARHIRVEIDYVKFRSHPLSVEQDILSDRLERMVRAFERAVVYSRSEYYFDRIGALRRDLLRDPAAERSILSQIVECHRMCDEEEAKVVSMRDTIQATWEKLRELRHRGPVLTSVALKWKARKFSEDQAAAERRDFEEALLGRAAEECRLAELLRGAEQDVEEVKQRIRQRHRDLGLREPGETQWLPEIGRTTTTQFEALPRSDQQRISDRSKVKIFVSFNMGTSEVQSDPSTLDPSFLAKANVGCHAVAMHIPFGVKVHVIQWDGHDEQELATVILPVFNGDAPEFCDYEFSGTLPLPPDGLFVEGVLRGRCFLQPEPDSLRTIATPGNIVRPLSMPRSPNLQAKKVMEDHDPNDPYIVAAFADLKAERGEHAICGRFVVDPEVEMTTLAAIAPSEMWMELETRRADVIRLNPEPPQKPANPRPSMLYDVVTQPPLPSFFSFIKSVFGFFFYGRKARDVGHSSQLQSNSSIFVGLGRVLNLPKISGNRSIVASISFMEQTLDISADNMVFPQTVEIKIIKEDEKLPYFVDVQDRAIRIDIFEKEHFLATCQIPLRSIFLDGTLNASVVLLTSPFYLHHSLKSQIPRMLFAISMRPKLYVDEWPLPAPSSESAKVNDRAHKFWNELRKLPTKRRFAFLVMSMSHQAVLPIRLVTKQPLQCAENERALLSFVAAIPFVPDSNIPDQVGFLWKNPQEFLGDRVGTAADHAVLLCSTLLARDAIAWVVLGKEVSTGLSAFVLTRSGDFSVSDKEACRLIDPIRGNVFRVDDRNCPLFDIGTAFDSENIWHNVQQEGKSSGMSWNFSDVKCWKRFFTDEFVDSKEKEDSTSELEVTPAETSLEKTVARSVRQIVQECVAEVDRDVRWNAPLSRKLHSVLVERRKEGATAETIRVMVDRLKSEHQEVKLSGSPFHISLFPDEQSEIRLREEIAIEIEKRRLCHGDTLSLAVLVTAYPNGIFAIAIWIVAQTASCAAKTVKEAIPQEAMEKPPAPPIEEEEEEESSLPPPEADHPPHIAGERPRPGKEESNPDQVPLEVVRGQRHPEEEPKSDQVPPPPPRVDEVAEEPVRDVSHGKRESGSGQPGQPAHKSSQSDQVRSPQPSEGEGVDRHAEEEQRRPEQVPIPQLGEDQQADHSTRDPVPLPEEPPLRVALPISGSGNGRQTPQQQHKSEQPATASLPSSEPPANAMRRRRGRKRTGPEEAPDLGSASSGSQLSAAEATAKRRRMKAGTKRGTRSARRAREGEATLEFASEEGAGIHEGKLPQLHFLSSSFSRSSELPK